jgi:hypothetical protein
VIRAEDSDAVDTPGSPELGGQFADLRVDMETGTDDDAFVTELITLRCAISGCEVGLEACVLDCIEEGFARHCSYCVTIETLISAKLSSISCPC